LISDFEAMGEDGPDLESDQLPSGRSAPDCGGSDTRPAGSAYSLRLPAVMPSM
jgi:hypothetical protein